MICDCGSIPHLSRISFKYFAEVNGYNYYWRKECLINPKHKPEEENNFSLINRTIIDMFTPEVSVDQRWESSYGKYLQIPNNLLVKFNSTEVWIVSILFWISKSFLKVFVTVTSPQNHFDAAFTLGFSTFAVHKHILGICF